MSDYRIAVHTGGSNVSYDHNCCSAEAFEIWAKCTLHWC